MANKEFLDKDGLLYYHSKIKKEIPTKTSDITNDSGYVTNANLAGAILSEDQPTDVAYSLWIEESDLTGSGTTIPIDIIDVGTIVPFSGTTAPKNWLICDGSAVSRTTYIELFEVIGTAYGSGDGSTTFNLPDFRGKTLVGLNSDDTDFSTIGQTGGEKTHKLTVSEMPSHGHGWNGVNDGASASSSAGNYPFRIYQDKNVNWNGTASHILSTGGDGAHNNLQPYATVNYIIKYHREQTSSVTAIVEDSLTSSSSTNALSANQGKILDETKVSSTTIRNIVTVTEYPETPDENTLYIKVGS